MESAAKGMPVLGAVAGDMVGSVFERQNVKTEDFPLFCEKSRFTDDSVMTLAVAQALLDAKEGMQPLSHALVARMQELGNKYPDAGYGGKFRLWLRAEKPEPYGSLGNGAAMRVLPVGWMFDTLEAVEWAAAETAKVSHNHAESIRAAQAVAACILLGRQGFAKDDVRSYVQGRVGYRLDFTLEQVRPSYRFDATCPGSVPQAIEAFLESSSFEDTVRKAVSIGGDSDTIAAIAGSIAQAYFGMPDHIAGEVRTRLSADLLEINDSFCARFVS